MTRIAVAIQTLTDEVHARSPLTTIYHYDNGPARDSDHDPNSYGVICACDIMQGHGLDLHKLSREIVAARHPECKYVIYNHQIASRNTDWEWVDYHGESDHEDHIHVSVGVGPDGYSRPPYDSTRRWLGADMPITGTDVVTLLTTAAFPYSKPTQSLGTTWLSTFNDVKALVAEAAADKARDAVMLAAIQALPGGGQDVDTTVLLAAVADVKSSVLAKLEAEVNQLQAERDDLLEKLAQALAS